MGEASMLFLLPCKVGAFRVLGDDSPDDWRIGMELAVIQYFLLLWHVYLSFALMVAWR